MLSTTMLTERQKAEGAGKGLEEGKGEGLAHLQLRDPLHTWPYEYFLSPAVDVLVMGFILSYHNVPREEYYQKNEVSG